MMRGGIALALCAGLAQPALALSCLQPDIARDYADASASGDRYVVVKGDLFFDETLLPRKDFVTQSGEETTELAAWLNGHSLTQDGFTQKFERDVVLRVECLGPWCGGAAKGNHLAFLKQEGTEFVVTLRPCGGMTYPEPTEEQIAAVTNCMRGGSC